MALRLSLAMFMWLAVQIMLLLPHQTGACFLGKSSTPTYRIDKTLAKRLAYYTQTAYHGRNKDPMTWSCTTCRKHLASFKPKAVVVSGEKGRAIAGYDSHLKAIVVTFRGNANWKNHWSSAHIGLVRPKKISTSKSAGKVHGGFLKIYYSLRSSLLHNIRELVAAHPKASFDITGHSMGGTLAVLLSLDLKLRYPKRNLVMYNFGSPRLGDKAFRKFFNKHVPKAMRLVHYPIFDIIPSLPPNEVGYHHVGNSYLDKSLPSNHCYYMKVRISTSKLCIPSGKRRRRSVGSDEV